MKKLTKIVSCLILSAVASSTFAAIKVGAKPEVPFYGQDYVGEIMAAVYGGSNDPQSILILTKADPRDPSRLHGLTLRITNKDLPFGHTLASSVGKKIAVSFSNSEYDIQTVSIVTDEYWFGNNRK